MLYIGGSLGGLVECPIGGLLAEELGSRSCVVVARVVVVRTRFDGVGSGVGSVDRWHVHETCL